MRLLLLASLFALCQCITYNNFKGVSLSGMEWACNPWWCPNPAHGENTNQGCSGWFPPTTADIDNFLAQKFNLIRLPVSWERVLNGQIRGTFWSTYWNIADNLISYATGKGMYVIIDIHNYGRWTNTVNVNAAISASSTPSYADFAYLWTTLANKYKSNSKVIFGLMNEPHDISVSTWTGAVQAAITAIRNTGATNLITVPGIAYTGGQSWSSSGNSGITGLSDPGKNSIFEIHQYLDYDYSGTHASCDTDPTVSLAGFTSWAKSHGFKAIIGEFGGQDSGSCPTKIANMLNYLKTNSAVYVGWVWWVAGQSYASCNPSQLFSIEANGPNTATIIGWLKPFLTASTWTWTSVAAAEVNDNTAQQTYTYAIIGAVVVLVLIAAILYTIKRQSRNRSKSVTEQSLAMEPVEKEQEQPQPRSSETVQPQPTTQEWEQRTDFDSGKSYWYNNVTGVSTYENPALSQ